MGDHSFMVRAPRFSNSLSIDIRSACFKQKLKTFLFSKNSTTTEVLCVILSTKEDSFSVGPSQPDIIGLPTGVSSTIGHLRGL